MVCSTMVAPQLAVSGGWGGGRGGSRREEVRLLRSCACRTDSWNTITALSGSAFEFLILSFPGVWAPVTWFRRRRRRHSCLSIIDYYEAARLPTRNETKGEMKTASPPLEISFTIFTPSVNVYSSFDALIFLSNTRLESI